MVLFTYLWIIVLFFYILCMVESIVLSSIFEVVTYIDVPAFKYRFPTVIDMLPIELFRFQFSMHSILFS